MKQVLIDKISDLQDQFNGLANSFVFRGHANSEWTLQSSLERALGEEWPGAKEFEKLSLDRFKSKFHLYDRENVAPDSTLAWLAIMQHYGVPTRLLDFTESPYVALYFALEAYQPDSKRNLAVYALDYLAVGEASYSLLSDSAKNLVRHPRAPIIEWNPDSEFDVIDAMNAEILMVTEPKRHNQRLDRQGGTFLIASGHARIEDALRSQTYKNCDFIKYTIDASLYSAAFALLRKMNVTSKSLYGDLDGLARSVRMEIQVYATERGAKSVKRKAAN